VDVIIGVLERKKSGSGMQSGATRHSVCNRKDSSESIVGSVSFDCNLGVRDPMGRTGAVK